MTENRPLEALTDDGMYRRLVEAATDYAVYMLDPDGVVVSWNPGAQRLLGYLGSEIIGENFAVFYTNADRGGGAPQRSLKLAATAGRFENKGWRVGKDGSRVWAHVILDPVRTPAGAVMGYTEITHDLTELKTTEAALHQSQEQLRLLGPSVRDYSIYMLDPAGIVVTWNADAERITGYCAEEIIGTHFSRLYTDADRQIGAPEAALEKAASEGRFEDEGWRVGKDGKRLWAHVILDRIQNETGEITGFAKIAWHFMEHTVTDKQIDPTDPKPINISGLIEDMEDVIQRTAGVAIQVETVAADRLWNTMVDRNQFEATVMNLCIDAREAMRAGGHLTIETANTWLDERAPQECDAKLGQFVTLSFSDTGTGTLVDRKFAGTGLALSGIDAFARQSGGYMRVEAGPGKRRKVCLHLPRHNGVRTVGKPAVGCSRILLVDDNLDVVVTTAAFMENAGYWVIRATSADQALGFLAAGERFDVLVSDYAMPGMHGLDLIEQARMIQPGLAALLITGFAGAIDPALLPAGVEILAKPFRQRQLVDAVLDASMRVQVEPEPATIKV